MSGRHKEAIVTMRLAIVISLLAVWAALALGCEPMEGQPRKYPDSTDTATDTDTDTTTDTSTNTST